MTIVVSTSVLLAILVVATTRKTNIGLLAFGAAFVVGVLVCGMSVDTVMANFPTDLFLAIFGLTFLSAFAHHNQSLDLVAGWTGRIVRGRAQPLAPWVFFFLAAALMSAGVVLAVGVVAPVAISHARHNRQDQIATGLMVVHGAMAGALSPSSIYGDFLTTFFHEQNIAINPLILLVSAALVNVLAALAVWFQSKRRRDPAVPTERSVDPAPVVVAIPPTPRPSPLQALTLLAMAAVALSVAVFRADLGVTAVTAAGLLALISPKGADHAVRNAGWSVVVLTTGMVTFIGVWQHTGATDTLGAPLATIGAPFLVVLLLCYFEGVVSSVASSIATMGATVALATPLLAKGLIGPTAFAAAIGISATVVDVSPLSAQGAIVLSAFDEDIRAQAYRRMLRHAAITIAIAPALIWASVFLPLTFAV